MDVSRIILKYANFLKTLEKWYKQQKSDSLWPSFHEWNVSKLPISAEEIIKSIAKGKDNFLYMRLLIKPRRYRDKMWSGIRIADIGLRIIGSGAGWWLDADVLLQKNRECFLYPARHAVWILNQLSFLPSAIYKKCPSTHSRNVLLL